MSRTRSVLFLLVLACGVFTLQQLQRVFGDQQNPSLLLPVMFVLLALLSLVLKPRSVVLYGFGITALCLGTWVLQITNPLATLSANVLTLLEVATVCSALGILFKKLWYADWSETKRYAQVPTDPWVSLDKGLDPTIESRMEDR